MRTKHLRVTPCDYPRAYQIGLTGGVDANPLLRWKRLLPLFELPANHGRCLNHSSCSPVT